MAMAVVFVFLFFMWVNHKGAKAWAETKEFLEGQGESLDFSLIGPNRFPAEENFCAIPLIAAITRYEVDQYGERTDLDPESRQRFVSLTFGDPREDEGLIEVTRKQAEAGRVLLEAWLEFFKGKKEFDTGDEDWPVEKRILKAVSKFDPEFEEILGAARERPKAAFDLKFKPEFEAFMGSHVEYLIDVIDCCVFLRDKGRLLVACGDTQSALECVQILLRFAEACRATPDTLHFQVDRTIFLLIESIVNEGIIQDKWKPEDLRWLIEEMGKI